ncbi:hypothetical protein [Corynebacterium glucuronolyticum]|nr:hypothetical protein [Corynebacterium glucuronolyticum]QRP70041.1 hypothetical protein I6J21_09660 [Corynebacterium glucuronolyticum]
MRAGGSWGYSEPLQGAYRYVSPDSSRKEFSFGIEGIDSFVADGIVLVLSTFGKLNCPLKDVVEFVAIDIHGFEKGTCEECVESYEMSLPSASSAKNLVPTSNQFVGRRSGEVVAKNGSSRMRAQIKRIPGAVTLYRTLKG